MAGLLTTLAVLLFFAPLSFIYGRSVAVRIGQRAAERGCSRAAIGLPKLVWPLVVGAALVYRVAGSRLDGATTGWGTLDAALGLADFLGGIALALFFVAIPFVFGRFFGVLASMAGYFGSSPASPLRDADGTGNGAGSSGPEGPERNASA